MKTEHFTEFLQGLDLTLEELFVDMNLKRKLSQRHISIAYSIAPQLNIALKKFFRLSPKLHTPSTHPLLHEYDSF